MSSLPKNLCIKPWLHVVARPDGAYSVCCKHIEPIKKNGLPVMSMKDAWQSEELHSLRQSFLKNDKPTSCHVCWAHESTGATSDRKDKLIQVSELLGPRYLTEVIKKQDHELQPVSLDFKFSNLCNLKCRICSSTFSSQWALEDFKAGINLQKTFSKPNQFNSETEEFETFFEWLPSIVYIEIYGGEPFVSPQHEQILKACIEKKQASKITLRYNSNGTISPTKFIDLWSHFKSVSIQLSIDDIGARFEYQRHGAKWSSILKNLNDLQLIDLKNLTWDFSSTISIFNVYYLPEFLEWAQPFNVKTYLSLLHAPYHFQISVLPQSLKKKVLERLQKIENSNYHVHPHSPISSLINGLYLDHQLPDLLSFFKETTNLIDLRRNEKFIDVFPELWELME